MFLAEFVKITSRNPSSVRSTRNLCFAWMWRVLWLLLTFSDMKMIPLLSTFTVAGVWTGMSSEIGIWTTKMIHLASSLDAMCSASEEECVTMLACLGRHKIGIPHKTQMKVMTDFPLSQSSDQSLSEWPTSLHSWLPPQRIETSLNPMSVASKTNLMILDISLQAARVGDFKTWVSSLTGLPKSIWECFNGQSKSPQSERHAVVMASSRTKSASLGRQTVTPGVPGVTPFFQWVTLVAKGVVSVFTVLMRQGWPSHAFVLDLSKRISQLKWSLSGISAVNRMFCFVNSSNENCTTAAEEQPRAQSSKQTMSSLSPNLFLKMKRHGSALLFLNPISRRILWGRLNEARKGFQQKQPLIHLMHCSIPGGQFVKTCSWGLKLPRRKAVSMSNTKVWSPDKDSCQTNLEGYVMANRWTLTTTIQSWDLVAPTDSQLGTEASIPFDVKDPLAFDRFSPRR